LLERAEESALVGCTEQPDLTATVDTKTRLQALEILHVVVTTWTVLRVFEEVALHFCAPVLRGKTSPMGLWKSSLPLRSETRKKLKNLETTLKIRKSLLSTPSPIIL